MDTMDLKPRSGSKVKDEILGYKNGFDAETQRTQRTVENSQ